MNSTRVHAFTNDALGHHDAVALADLLRRRELSEAEVLQAVEERARRVDPLLRGIELPLFDRPLRDPRADAAAPFAGVPTVLKDNIDVAGLPTRHGSRAMHPPPAPKHSVVTEHVLAQGYTVVGKSRLPEFGFSPSTEFEDEEPTRNPWNPAYSSGASSGGSAALVAAGVVPIAHANDGGGSIRIPASCCGLVGLKFTRRRFVEGEAARLMPVPVVTEGVVTRSVRDTAHFMAAIERRCRSRLLRPVGLVEGPSSKRLRIGLVIDSINDNRSCAETRAVVERVAHLLERLGHRIEPLLPPVPSSFDEDFKLYWGFLALALSKIGSRTMPGFDARRLEGFSKGLAGYCSQRLARTPLAIARLRASALHYAYAVRNYDAVLSPVLTHAVPKLGYLNPGVPFDELFARISKWAAFTPLNNATGSPAIAVPVGLSESGVPIGVQLSGRHGGERVLLELAYALESELRFAPIDAVAAPRKPELML
jgi:amidase